MVKPTLAFVNFFREARGRRVVEVKDILKPLNDDHPDGWPRHHADFKPDFVYEVEWPHLPVEGSFSTSDAYEAKILCFGVAMEDLIHEVLATGFKIPSSDVAKYQHVGIEGSKKEKSPAVKLSSRGRKLVSATKVDSSASVGPPSHAKKKKKSTDEDLSRRHRNQEFLKMLDDDIPFPSVKNDCLNNDDEQRMKKLKVNPEATVKKGIEPALVSHGFQDDVFLFPTENISHNNDSVAANKKSLPKKSFDQADSSKKAASKEERRPLLESSNSSKLKKLSHESSPEVPLLSPIKNTSSVPKDKDSKPKKSQDEAEISGKVSKRHKRKRAKESLSPTKKQKLPHESSAQQPLTSVNDNSDRDSFSVSTNKGSKHKEKKGKDIEADVVSAAPQGTGKLLPESSAQLPLYSVEEKSGQGSVSVSTHKESKPKKAVDKAASRKRSRSEVSTSSDDDQSSYVSSTEESNILKRLYVTKILKLETEMKKLRQENISLKEKLDVLQLQSSPKTKYSGVLQSPRTPTFDVSSHSSHVEVHQAAAKKSLFGKRSPTSESPDSSGSSF